MQALSGEMGPFLCSGSHQAQRDCQPSALNCFVEAMSQCVPPIPIRPCVLKYLGKTHNLWLRSTLMLEQQAFEKGLSLHIKPKQSTEFYEQESITPPQQVEWFMYPSSFCLCCQWYSWQRKFCVLKVFQCHSKWTCVLNFQLALFWPVSEFSLKYPSIQAAYAKQSSYWDTSEYGCVCPLYSLKMCFCIPSGDPRLAGGALLPSAGGGHVGGAVAEEMQVSRDKHCHCLRAAWLLWTGRREWNDCIGMYVFRALWWLWNAVIMAECH